MEHEPSRMAHLADDFDSVPEPQHHVFYFLINSQLPQIIAKEEICSRCSRQQAYANYNQSGGIHHIHDVFFYTRVMLEEGGYFSHLG